MKMPSFRTATSIKDLQYNSTPSFEDVPRTPSLSESFKRSASIKVRQTDGESSSAGAAVQKEVAPAPVKKRKLAPKLNISAISDEYDNDRAAGGAASSSSSQVEEMSATFATGFQHKVITASGVVNMGSERKGSLLAPAAEGIFVSESGTVNTGGWKIRETGMSFTGGGQDTGGDGGGDNSLLLSRPAQGGAHRAGKSCRRLDFLEIGTLGSGASGSVIEALHVPTLTLVAMKMLPVYQVDKLQSIARELAVLYTNLAELSLINGSLDDEDGDGVAYRLKPQKSRHVLAMYDAFTDLSSGFVHLVVEYMDGGSLQDIVDNGGCSDESVLADLSYQAVDGLAFLHNHKQIHRDIKPGNILLNSLGEVKIADFGITKVVDGAGANARSFVGTMCYMAPERISGDVYSFQSDVWSLGLTILAVCRGEFPLAQEAKDAGYWGLLKVICEDEPPSPGEKFSPAFNEFIAACLNRDASKRPLPDVLLESASFLQKGQKINVQITQEQVANDHLRRKSMAPSTEPSSRGGSTRYFEENAAAAVVSSEDNSSDNVDRVMRFDEEGGCASVPDSGKIHDTTSLDELAAAERDDTFDVAPPARSGLLVRTSFRGSRVLAEMSSEAAEGGAQTPTAAALAADPSLVSPLSMLGTTKPWQVQRKGSKNSSIINDKSSYKSLINALMRPSSSSSALATDASSAGLEPDSNSPPTVAMDKLPSLTDGSATKLPAINTEHKVMSLQQVDASAAASPVRPSTGGQEAAAARIDRSAPPAPMLKKRGGKGAGVGGSKSLLNVSNSSIASSGSNGGKSDPVVTPAVDVAFVSAVESLREEHLLTILECLEDKCRVEEYAARESKYHENNYRTASMSIDYEDDLGAFGPRDHSVPTIPVRVPNIIQDIGKWKHLAAQLLLPVDVVVRAARTLISEKYFMQDDFENDDDD